LFLLAARTFKESGKMLGSLSKHDIDGSGNVI